MQQAQDIDYKALYEGQLTHIQTLEANITALTHQLHQLQKMLFGSRQERFVPSDPHKDSAQLALGLGGEQATAVAPVASVQVTTTHTKTVAAPPCPKTHPNRGALAAHLRREKTVVQPDIDITGLKKIGEDITETLCWKPGELFVKQIIIPRYALPLGDGEITVISATAPARTLEKCLAGEGLVAQLIVDKYVDHLPLNRQLQRFDRCGVKIPDSTIYDWTRAGLNCLLALYGLHKRLVLQSGYLHADETGISVLDSDKKGASHQGYYWVYHNSGDKMVLFDYRPGRGREGPEDILKDFGGYLQTDGYAAYEQFDKRPGITLMHCMAHARRKFVESLDNDRARSEHALGMFGELYAVERSIKEQGLEGEAVVAERQQRAIPVLKALKEWMVSEYENTLPKSPIRAALAYCLPRWEKLSVYTRDAMLRIDNNAVENAIRPVALGRRNYLFAGSHDAAQRAAMAYSLFATCKLHGINPYEWLKDVLERMHLYTTTNVKELLPQYWNKPQ